MSQRVPQVSDLVHYTSYGTPNGEYPSVCRAAVVTEVPPHSVGVGEADGWTVSLCVLNPEGMFFNRAVQQSDGAETPGSPECPNAWSHGNPFRYCACGWIEASHRGGTWHWPERV
ncbi:hypothetical protein OG884_18715 [Streptosporangium sp. NBC_01755]|uniref:hypothetical protein n=1 Tax=Streptosporangium sp. NBC_01755 TaxID=2975949 RepID=UPI002DDC7755|nr:hypothetical protein [Streptosporangium sp. NBC_01755]WSD01456.1 hypothetical protein OG884_05885 [Streptosporangium sp. NBC_01755]WSD03841.1 hypothetical protein OG884_18715 [Streptosporangium sp. NBC_01755]